MTDEQKMRKIERFTVQLMRGIITKAEFVQKVIETVEEV